ncbi:hypothetical protein ACFWYI_0018355, partial [Salmonella enterica]
SLSWAMWLVYIGHMEGGRPFRHLLRALSISSGLFLCLRFNYCSIRKNPLHFSLFFYKALKVIIPSVNEHSD